ncbi:unnamed protein product [Owenia fusiformis]|uniref:Nephrin n=1 Tax=Owenia fusiformis TaxID=6347 RepID=A0A8S4PVQ0_OWEFU|nr:unnamed protein product [Owenia fusiformis]
MAVVSSGVLGHNQMFRTMLSSIWIYKLCFVLVLLSQNINAQTWTDKPAATSVKIGLSVTLPCGVTPAPTKIVWLRYVGGSSQILFIDSSSFDSPARYSLDGTSLKITGVTMDDDTDFQCQASYDSTILQERFPLTVLVVPDVPVITQSPSTVLQEGDNVELTCSTSNGNPIPVMTWRRNGEILPEGEVINASVKQGTSTHRITRTVTKEDHDATFDCDVINEANKDGPEKKSERILAVQYKPYLSLGSFNPLQVIEGDDVTITCSIDANPTATSIRWEKDGTPLGETSNVISRPSASSGESGNYTCIATNALAETQASVHLDIQYAPKLTTALDTYTIDEGQNLNVYCNIDANPAETTLYWKHLSSLTTFQSHILSLPGISRAQEGTYQCISESVLTPSGGQMTSVTSTKDITVIVQYLPGQAVVDPVEDVIKGNSVTLSCSTSDRGVPEGDFVWQREDASPGALPLHIGATYTIAATSISNNGRYVCTVKNDVGQGPSGSVLLTVNELPRWLQNIPPLPQTKTINVSESDFSIRCEVRGKPSPQVTWSKNGIALISDLYTFDTQQVTIEEHSFHVISTLRLNGPGRNGEGLTKGDSGNYSCCATNSLMQSGTCLTSSMQLFIQYPPEVTTPDAKVAVDKNDTASLACTAQSLPLSTIQWYKGDELIIHGGKYDIATVTKISTNQVMSTLNITGVMEADFGNFRCHAVNTLGSNHRMVNLTVKTTPDAPSGLQLVETTWESAQLSWVPGFDGGHPQTFVLTQFNGESNKRVPVNPDGASTYNVTMLYPNTNYTFSVFGENRLGGGPYSNSIQVTTKSLALPTAQDVKYDTDTRTITFETTTDNVCVRILTSSNNNNWKLYEECAPPAGGSLQITDASVKYVQVLFCHQTRRDVCSRAASAAIVEPATADIPVETIIIVASVCGAIILILVVIFLIVYCRKRKANKKEYASSPTISAPQPVATPPSVTNTGTVQGISNPALDATDFGPYAEVPGYGPGYDLDDPTMTDMHYSHPPKMNGGPPNGYGSHYGNMQQQQWPPAPPSNGSVPNNYETYELQNQENLGMDENTMNERNAYHTNPANGQMYDQQNPEQMYAAINKNKKRPRQNGDPSYMSLQQDTPPSDRKSPFIIGYQDTKNPETRSGNESGYSTPDPTKPKKVIYEVIV